MRIEWKIENGEWKMNAMVSLALRAIHLVSRLRRVADMCSSRVSGIAYRLSNGRTLCAPCGRKNPLPFSIFEAVVGLWSAPDYLRKGVKIRGWKPWCLPSCAPAGQARFRSLRKRSTTVWQRLTNNTDNRNFEKAKEEGKNLPLSFTFSEIPADGGVPPDDKSGSPPRRTSPHTRS